LIHGSDDAFPGNGAYGYRNGANGAVSGATDIGNQNCFGGTVANENKRAVDKQECVAIVLAIENIEPRTLADALETKNIGVETQYIELKTVNCA